MTDPRVEAAAKALTNEGAAPGSSIHSWRCEYPDRCGPCGCVYETAEIIVAAADEAERAAGVIRLDANDPGLIEVAARHLSSPVRDWQWDHISHESDRNYWREGAARDLFAALAAAGAQPPPKEDDRG